MTYVIHLLGIHIIGIRLTLGSAAGAAFSSHGRKAVAQELRMT
jgi:hypothetical protein